MIYSSCAFAYLYLVIPGLEETEHSSDQEHAGNAKSEEEDEVDDSVFIPLGWARPRPRAYYKGSDPEWQEFIKLFKDKKRTQDVQGAFID